MEYTVIIEPDEDGFMASFPDVPGCFSDGGTYEETFQNASEALEEHLATLAELGKPVPQPRSRAATISVKAS